MSKFNFAAAVAAAPIFEPWDIKTRKQRKRIRKPNLASALKQANKVGSRVSSATIAADGSVLLTFGEAPSEQRNELDQWLEKHRAN